MTVILGFIVLAVVVVLYFRWEWGASANDRNRRAEMCDQIRRVK